MTFHPFLCSSAEKTSISSRLDEMENESIYKMCTDKTESLNTRFFGAMRLPATYQTQLIDLLILDKNDLLWTTLHTFVRPTDTTELRATLSQYWNESDNKCRTAAIHILARFGDESVLNIATELLASSVRLERVLGVACLRMSESKDALDVLRMYWPQTEHPLGTRVQAAGDLLRAGEVEPLSFLIETAQHDRSETAYSATISVYQHDKYVGLQLMLGILNATTHAAHRNTVWHVATLMRDQSIRDRSDGLSIAREWIVRKLESR